MNKGEESDSENNNTMLLNDYEDEDFDEDFNQDNSSNEVIPK